MPTSKQFPAIFTLGILTILALVFLLLTDLVPAVGTWYSADPVLRLQTEALLHGHLALQPLPYGHGPDWAWGNGLQQVWGLGVPLLQLPFQLLGMIFNGFGFPDRLIFLIFYLATAALFWHALTTGTETVDPGERLKIRLLTLPIILYAFLNHDLVNMIQGKFERYEEVIAYGYLWSLLLFALLAIFFHRRQRHHYLLLCCLAGFAVHLRPTLGAYGGFTFVLAFFLAWKDKTHGLWLGLVGFLAGIGSFLLLNGIRFGNPLEIGHQLVLTSTPISDYIVRFDNPMTWVPFSAAAREQLSSMFFLDFFPDHVDFPWQIPIPRWREFNYKPYFMVEFILLLLAWPLPLILWLRRKLRKLTAPGPDEQLVLLGLAWSLLSFGLLFVFYCRWPGLVSRYLVDFAPAIVVAIASFYLWVGAFLPKLTHKALWGAALTAMTVWILVVSQVASIYGDPILVTDLAGAKHQLSKARNSGDGPALPDSYRCGDFETRYGIPENNLMWKTASDCGVAMVSTHFFVQPECLEISLLPFSNAPEEMRRGYSDQEIEVKVGAEHLRRVAERANPDIPGGKDITFCREKSGPTRWANTSPIEMVSIKWLNLRVHPKFETIPFALVSLRKVSR